MSKAPHEAIGIPTKEANAAGLRCTKQVVNMLSDQAIQNVELEVEKGIIRHETRLIVDKCFELGNGDMALGVCRGVKAGVVDVPFAPCRANAGQMLPARDNEGAVRIMNIGNLPFDKELRDFHAAKMAQRAKEENRKVYFPDGHRRRVCHWQGPPGGPSQILTFGILKTKFGGCEDENCGSDLCAWSHRLLL